VLELIARGWNNQEIARELSISLSTVQFHVSNIFAKLKVHNRIEAATFAVRHQFPAYSTLAAPKQ
jgi:DNA-binding NarL/FixJ family response regulator